MKRSYKRPKIFDDYDVIKEELEISNLNYLSDLMKRKNQYLLIEKLISFADIPTSRKLTYVTSHKRANDAFTLENIERRNKNNIAFYSSYDEMVSWEYSHKEEKLFFCQTKQASIYLPSQFYTFINVPNPTTRTNQNGNWHGQYKLNSDNINVLICNSSVTDYFNKNLTQKTYEVLNRDALANELNLESGFFSKTNAHITPHGLGTSADGLLTLIRENMFAKDKILILVEKCDGITNIYFAFYRNPKFFLLNDIYNRDYILSKYAEEYNNDDNQETRKGQAKWRNELAELAISLSPEDNDFVECPFTGVKVQYPIESAFLRASHIKAYSKCKGADGKINVAEAYDLDNGFLVIADVDALFDKHLISVDPKTNKIVKSKLLTEDVIKHLSLKKVVDQKFITEKKGKYLKIHFNEFIKKESASL